MIFFLGGRGSGKTASGSNGVNEAVSVHGVRNLLIVGATSTDTRAFMIDGPSGLIATAPPGNIPTYHPSEMVIRWPNGAFGWVRSAEEPDRLRGPNSELTWADEVASWDESSWDMVEFATRIGMARIIVTTTPKPLRWLYRLTKATTTLMRYLATIDNVKNLNSAWYATLSDKYAGTRLEKQELWGQFTMDMAGNMWTEEMIESMRVDRMPCAPISSAVGLDPQAKNKKESNQSGIVGVSLGEDMIKYIRADWSGRFSAMRWCQRATELSRMMRAPIVYEDNQGGNMIKEVFKLYAGGENGELDMPRLKAITAVLSKKDRAEPLSLESEQGKVKLVGRMPLLEEQLLQMTMDGYTGKGSPDRLDATVHAAANLRSRRVENLITSLADDPVESATL